MRILFQLTTSHGGRLYVCIISFIISYLSTHDLTRRSTLRLHHQRTAEAFFQLTTSHGGRRKWAGFSDDEVVFQLTTSHGGRLAGLSTYVNQLILSTHDLTRRSTDRTDAF